MPNGVPITKVPQKRRYVDRKRSSLSTQRTPAQQMKVFRTHLKMERKSLFPPAVRCRCRLSFISPEQIKEAAFNPGIITLRSLSYHGGITVIKMGYSEAPAPRSFVMAWGRLKDGSCWRWAWAGGKSSWGTAAIILISCAERLHAMLIASRGIFNKYFIPRSIITA